MWLLIFLTWFGCSFSVLGTLLVHFTTCITERPDIIKHKLDFLITFISLGTPVQNDLQEFFALIDFVNPGILGPLSSYRKIYEEPIILSRQPSASEVWFALISRLKKNSMSGKIIYVLDIILI